MKSDCPAWAPPLLAVQFLTRVPVPGLAGLSSDAVRVGLGRAARWFPLVGALIGVVTAGTLLLAEQLWPRVVAVVLALIVEARLTGAFHEDAVADFCDGVGGGRDAQHVRQIMKDSRIGSYGALGLCLAVVLRAALMCFLPAASVFIAIVAASTFGRLVAALTMVVVPTAPTDAAPGLTKDIAARLGARDAMVAIALAVPGLLLFALRDPLATLGACVTAGIFLYWFRALLMRRVGGSTGDCLGFAAYAGQLTLLLAATAS